MLKKLPLDEMYQTRSDRLASFNFAQTGEETVQDFTKSKGFLETILELTHSLASALTRSSTPEGDTDLSYTSNSLMHVGTVYMGSNKQPLEVVFDTGSSYLVLEGVQCNGCVSTPFDPSGSTTYERISNRPIA
jgi:hypothetical protein